MFDKALLEDHIKRAEAPGGKPVLFPYQDSVGLITIAWGRNLDHKGISPAIAQLMFDEDYGDALGDCESLPYWEQLDGARQMVLVDMVFNLGLTRFLRFKKLNVALVIKDYTAAAAEMVDSKWYRQVGRRAEKLRLVMISGVW